MITIKEWFDIFVKFENIFFPKFSFLFQWNHSKILNTSIITYYIPYCNYLINSFLLILMPTIHNVILLLMFKP